MTEVTEIQLNSQKRAEIRKLFDEKIKMKQKELEEIMKQRIEEQKKQEEIEIKKLRKKLDLLVKARPMPIYPEPCVIKSNKPLTVPETPNLITLKKKPIRML